MKKSKKTVGLYSIFLFVCFDKSVIEIIFQEKGNVCTM